MKYFFLILGVLLTVPYEVSAMPDGFELETVASGLNLPTAVAFAPDGRIFIAEKSGATRVVKDGTLLVTPFLQLLDLNDYADHGLIGIALDPDFASNGWVYLSYAYENDSANYEGIKTGRIVRVKAIGDTADMSTLEVLAGKIGGTPVDPSCEDYPAGADCIPSDEPSNSVGGLRFGPDGKLYATLGDGASFEVVDPRALRAQNLDSLAGKMLRVNPDGTAPSDNPFFTGDPTANRSKVWNYGLRNAFRFNFRLGDGALYVGDVGWFTWEEINVSAPGANFGWPCREGFAPTSGYECIAENYVDPLYAYGHNASGAGSVTAGAFVANDAYPVEYQGTYLFGDFAQNWIKRMVLDADGQVVTVDPFLDSADGPVEIIAGPDGLIYYLAIYSGELRRISYTLGNRQPIAQVATDPTSGLAPLEVAFSSAGSTDPDGDPLSYAWEFGDGTSSSEANPMHIYTINGVYVAQITVEDGQGGMSQAAVQITVGNEKPNAQILAPPNNSTYRPGHIIPLVGEGMDPEDGALPESAYAWRIILHHNTHIHILQTLTGSRPAFLAPNHNSDDVYVQVELTVQDSAGLTDTTSIDLHLAPPPSVEPHHVQTVLDTVSPVVGQPILARSTIGNTGTEEPILVDLEIYDASGAKVAQQFYDNEIIPTNTTKDYTITWTPSAPGDYRIAVGLIHAGWMGLYEWTNEAQLFSVSNGGDAPGDEALVFDGVDDYVDVDDWDIEEPNFTIEARFRADELDGKHRLLSKATGNTESDQLWMLGIDASNPADVKLQFVLETDGVVTELTGGDVQLGEWTHVAGVFDGTEMRLYQNGILVASVAKSGIIPQDRLVKVWIGDNPETGGLAFGGMLDVMRVWNIARSDEQIALNLTNDLGVDDRIGLIKYWSFDEGFGQDVLDRSNSGHHGRLGSTAGGDMNDTEWANGGPTVLTGTFSPSHQGTSVENLGGGAYKITSTVENTGTDPGHFIFDMEVYDAAGTQMNQQYRDGVTLIPGETRDFDFTWTIPGEGTYRVAVGLVILRWSGGYEWINEAALIEETPPPPSPEVVVYSGALGEGWASWSWEASTTFGTGIEVAYTHEWGGLYLHHDAFDTAGMSMLRFSISGGASGGQQLQVLAFDGDSMALPPRMFSLYLPEVEAGLWQDVAIPLIDLCIQPGDFMTGFVVQGTSGAIEPSYSIDDIRISS